MLSLTLVCPFVCLSVSRIIKKTRFVLKLAGRWSSGGGITDSIVGWIDSGSRIL